MGNKMAATDWVNRYVGDTQARVAVPQVAHRKLIASTLLNGTKASEWPLKKYVFQFKMNFYLSY